MKILDVDAIAGGMISIRGGFAAPVAVVVVVVVVVGVAVVVVDISRAGADRLLVCIRREFHLRRTVHCCAVVTISYNFN